MTISQIGNSAKNQRTGGEAWTVVWHKSGAVHVTGLKNDNRFRLEADDQSANPHSITMFPDTDTELYTEGNVQIQMTRQTAQNETPAVYKYQATIDGTTRDYWWYEGVPELGEETSIWLTEPGNGLAPGGSAGNRR